MQTGNCRVKTKIIICEVLVVTILVETDIPNKRAYAIYTMEKKCKMKNSDTVSILGSVTSKYLAEEATEEISSTKLTSPSEKKSGFQ